MCGIAGIYEHGGLGPEARTILESMMARILHRGPDEAGLSVGDKAALGCRRLAIVDIADGHQPMYADGGRIVSVANAEIYNHRELRAELRLDGAELSTHCDVEVLPHLYRRDGLQLAERLNGQFAFAVYDAPRDRLVLGRDQTGIAPLFWTRTARGIAFGSEIKALLAHPEVERRLDPAGLDQILTFPGLVSPRTLFAGIHALAPGHLLVVEGDRCREIRYWDYDFPTRADSAATEADEAELIDALDAALTQAVRRRLMADVPVGLYVSGGLDSSLIAALTHAIDPEQTRHSFSITFDRPEIDERRWQALMVDRLGSVHHAVEFDEDEVLSSLRDVVWAGETALKESYNACTLALARLVRREDMRVVLTGEGADELFGGYVGYRLDQARSDGGGFDLEALLEEETRARLWGDGGFFYERDYSANAELTQALLSPDLAARRPGFSALAAPPVDLGQLAGRSDFHKRSYLDLKLRLPDHLLADHSDRVAYAASVEARYPFLDPDVIDVARRIPPELMVRGGEEKYLLKALARRYLPAELVARRKFSFVAQGSPQLLRRGQDWILDLLSPETVARRGVFDPAAVARLRAQYEKPGFDISQTYEDDYLMIVLTTELLMDMFDLSSP
ncbi:asparagine synthase (glutamine-hydrolyzing) [Imhoffiella purpurea]|uniref:asparagine synthase (glutamine-hydrolyzing) n=1 Tax=Imhoffiella purpurea TaxID=1249627 RepID=W9W0R2_9GAMM|nr:asparagine synthase (glutamine-hydrolyzing) [Imhoffiella purpurea]EXJ16200.1 Asparagine synthetase [Imhoffiella purpurea]